MAVTSSRSRLEVRLVAANRKPLTGVRVTARRPRGKHRVQLAYDARSQAWTRTDIRVGKWFLHVKASGMEPQDREVSVSKNGTHVLFTLGPSGLPFYYRGEAKVPFLPLDLVAVSLKPGEEPNAADLESVARKLGLKPSPFAKLPQPRRPNESAQRIRRKLLDAHPNLARSDSLLSPTSAKPTNVWIFEVPPGPRRPSQLEEELRKLTYVRHVGQVVHRNPNGRSISFLTNQITVEFKRGLDTVDVEAAARERNMRVLRPVKYAGNGFLLESVDASSSEVLEICNRWREHPDVVWAEPNLVNTAALHFTPNDVDFEGQFHHPIIKSEDAWEFVRANPSSTAPLIAVIDEGCDVTHPDFVGNLTQPFNFSTLTANMFPSPHGTMTAGVAAAVYNNNLGIAGVAGMCRFMPIQLPQGEDQEYADMFVWCAGLDTGNPELPAPPNPAADILSNSWGLDQDRPLSMVVSRALDEVTANGRQGKGCVVVFSSGNDDDDFMVRQPWAAHPAVISVGSSTVDGLEVRADLSNFGSQLSICAPGGDIFGSTVSTTAASSPQNRTAGAYGVLGQTSCACAQVAGVAALILAVNPLRTAAGVKDILQRTAVKIDAFNTDPVGAYDADGHSNWYGFGRIDAAEAVRES